MNNTYFVGMPVTELPTPALVVDIEIMTRNMETMANYLTKVKTQLRPHAKTHKTPEIPTQQPVPAFQSKSVMPEYSGISLF